MSAITTGGWGDQGGLITTGGWGGQPAVRPLLPFIPRPSICDSLELRPAVLAHRAELEPRVGAKELRPQATWTACGGLEPRFSRSREVKPQFTGGGAPEGQAGPRLVGEELKPQVTSRRGERMPRATAEELRPQVVSGDKAETEPEQPKAASELKPKITGGKGD